MPHSTEKSELVEPTAVFVQPTGPGNSRPTVCAVLQCTCLEEARRGEGDQGMEAASH